MDVDLECIEIIFAQKLACGEPPVRQKALKELHDWLQQQSKTKPFTEADMMRLCKGLHYVLWMQDKMLLQEEMADNISNLINIFSTESERALFVRSVFKSLSKEWHAIDRWRMDKFLMMMRRVLRVLFVHIRNLEWKKEVRAPYWDAFKETTISADSKFSDGLKFHFAAIFLDELDNAGGLTKKQVTACLQPFAEILSIRKISNYLFDSILDEIFNTILHQRSEELAAAREAEEEGGEPMEEADQGIKFDYKALGKLLFDVGKRKETIYERRSKLYQAVKRFEVCAAGGDPFLFVAPEPQDRVSLKDMDAAEERLNKELEQFRQEKIQLRKDRKNIARGIPVDTVESKDAPKFTLKTEKKSKALIAKETKEEEKRKRKASMKKKKKSTPGAKKTIDKDAGKEKIAKGAKSPAGGKGKPKNKAHPRK